MCMWIRDKEGKRWRWRDARKEGGERQKTERGQRER